MKRVVTVLITVLALFMAATVVIAVWQEDLGWGWWWAVPLGGGFVLLIIGFRLIIQRLEEANRRRDAELDRLEGKDPSAPA